LHVAARNGSALAGSIPALKQAVTASMAARIYARQDV
jgi:hypothetical protein